jgi:TonB-linked SusC/RagA family outer membrane protein
MIFRKLYQSYGVFHLTLLAIGLVPFAGWANAGSTVLLNQEKQLVEVLKEMGEKYQVFFTYEAELLQDIEVDFDFRNGESLQSAIGRLLSNTGFEYKSYGDKYMVIFQDTKRGQKSAKKIGRKIKQLERLESKENVSVQKNITQPEALFKSLVHSIVELKSAFSVTGTVQDEDGQPLIGVNILVKGSGTGTVTDLDGAFSLELSDGQETLVFSYTGYEVQEVPVNGRNRLQIIMTESISQLEEIVVVGYGTVRKRDLTGSVGSLESKEFEDEVISNVSQGLQGKVAGVNVTTGTGAPGGNMIVRIRGNNSVIGSNDPLYVIDGFPVTSGNIGETNILSTINPGDIESIEVLKDASATAIYGSRGSNGVILITTKQGKSGANRVDFETSMGMRNVERTIDMMNSEQFIELANERLVNDGLNPQFSPQEAAALAQTNTDWQDEIFRPALVQNHTLRFSGGNDQTRYLVSGNYFSEEGIILGSDFERGSMRFNLDKEIGSRFELSSRLTFSRSVNNQINDDLVMISVLQAPPFFEPYNEDGTYVPGAELKPFAFSPSTGDNPVAVAREQLNKNRIDRVLANISGSYQLLEGLTLKVLLGVDQLSTQRDAFSPRVVEGGLPAGSGSKRFASTSSFLNENTLNYNATLGGNDRLDVTIGYTWQHEETDALTGSASGFVTDDLKSDNLGAGAFFGAPNTSFSEWTLLSFLGRANYSLNDKYLFTLSGRRDGSSRFGDGNKWGFFPSAAFAWRLAEEPFIKNNLTHISDLKFRASWGVSGNQAISPYQSLQRFTDVGLAFGGTTTTGFVAANLGNPDLRWETTEEFNVGLEFGLWNQRLSFSADYYVKNTEDLLALVNLPPTAGFATTLQNIGSTRNSGVELNLGAIIMRRNQLRWDANVNLAANRNEVTETASGQDIIAPDVEVLGAANIVRQGEPLSAFFGFETDGLTEDGMFNFVDQNGDGQVNNSDRVILGNPYPDFFYGLSTSFSYGNFSVRLNIQGELGKQIWNQNRYRFMASFHRGANAVADVVNRWTPENPDPNAPYPRASGTLNQQPSDWYIEDASYLRLQNLRINYNIPLNALNISGIRTASIYFSGQNLITFTGYSWYTPDVNTWASGDLRIGVDRQSYPSARSLLFGLKVGF